MERSKIYKLLAVIVCGVLAVLLVSRVSQWRSAAISLQEPFSRDIAGAGEVKSSEIIELANGATFDLVAEIVKKNIAGREVKMLAYNGSIPGPVLKVQKGAEVTINFTNKTDVDTTIHSHGVRLDSQYDGVPDVSQKPIHPGESFTYKVRFPDEGIFWYHPHIREDYAQELGLYGNYLVVPNQKNYWQAVNREVPIFLDDILMENGDIAAFSKQIANRTLMGRFGNTMLVNGMTDYQLEARQGDIMRLYITNAANVRTFNFTIPGIRLKLVGGDNGAYERESWTDAVVLAPSERAIVEVLFEKPGRYDLLNKTPVSVSSLGTIRVSEEKTIQPPTRDFSKLRQNDAVVAEMQAVRAYIAKEPDKKITLGIEMHGIDAESMPHSHSGGTHMMPDGTMMANGGMMGSADGIEWEDGMAAMNAMTDTNSVRWLIGDIATGKTNTDIRWEFKRGDKVKIRIFNDPMSMHPMQHPIHFHGQRFAVLAVDGKPADNLIWKDTVQVPIGVTVDILLDVSNPGDWMAHCHIAEHLESGMMFMFSVK
ncbi:MAG: hypothetical protein A3C84_04590 [Candidatus Ryanbacteria bacterium RIFCSPHIGHO2_02_FULL_48_12]|uniref:Copper oxidase n=1 Tax=Candidatus Ryanbacteria bacterium RIFCSPHIGHO2_01_FULL_48_27 TaxID=1802115 RepID=A0A1G2G626_9BACT|nr:MAG: hypothetical protein A2756_02210 [Candidatus Ryanbacteria bacterium RIFCSPHIGHO2_01_FULL_48_27]OGZ49857.1 MAG: hypothetical protein A3C84_04590 [Candidatus Ryanbacteria bacterium RIFCSPHIGHO2_02_FULL_48_12]